MSTFHYHNIFDNNFILVNRLMSGVLIKNSINLIKYDIKE
jgi:hypothetical protein